MAPTAIPRPPQKPVIGNVLDVSPNAPIRDLIAIAREMGPIFRLNMLGKPLTIVWGASLVEELCDERRFDKSVTRPLRNLRKVAHGLFVSATKDPNWSKAHNVLLPNFSQQAMRGYHPAMLEVVEQLSLKWQRLNADDEVDVTHDMTALTLDTIGLCGFGYRFNSFYREGYHPFVEAMVDALEISMQDRGLPLGEIFGKAKQRKLGADVEYMRGIVEKIVRERRAARSAAAGDVPPRDLLDHMLVSVDKKSGERLDDVQIREQIITFLIAGHETTSGMLSFAVFYLLRHPDVVARARDEVDRVFGTDLDRRPTVKQVDRLTYVQQILKESLRLWPTAPAFAVQPFRDETIGGAYDLAARTNVMVLLPMLHRDPAVWGEDAERFDPDRFAPEAEAARPAAAFKPFGNGQRACIGQQFAMQEATLALGTILQRFDLRAARPYELDVRESLTIKPVGLRVRVAPRTIATHRPAEDAPANGAHANGASGGAAAVAPASGPRHETPLLVLFGSNLGTTEEFARQFAEAATAQGFATSLGALDDFTAKLPTAGAVVIVTASYNGAPPDNAAAFYRWLTAGEAPVPALAGVRYAVFGAGNRNWASTYQSVPRAIDAKLAEFGAERILERGEGDARDDLDADFAAWRTPAWEALARTLGIELGVHGAIERPMYALEYVNGPAPNPLAQSHGATTMRLLVNRELQRSAERSTRHIEIALPPGTTYRVGDHLGIIPSNRETLVDRVLKRFEIEPDTYVRIHTEGRQRIASLPLDATLSVRRLLKNYVELQLVATRKQVALLAEHTRCPNTKPALLALASTDGSDTYHDEVKTKRLSILDLLERFPAVELPFSTYLEQLPLMAPRYYSISSSPVASPDRVSITVGVVRGPAHGGDHTYEGVASGHLAAREPGHRLNAFVKPATGFRLPDDPKRPIVMIGPGTGLAPFRGFLQERAHLRASGTSLGPAMLFFGCRRPEEDFIYRSELERFAADGIVDLRIAFSRHDGRRTYVQDLLVAESAAVWRLLQAGAIVYVCGDGSRMEPDVRAALVAICRERANVDEAAARTWLEERTRDGRYVLDVWATD